MASGKILLAYIEGKWKRVLLNAVMVLDFCAYCCQQFLPPDGALCGSDASCNNFCDGTYSISRSECCDCPCPGRRDFPKCWGWKISGASLQTNVPDIDNPGNYWQLAGDPSIPAVNECSDLSLIASYTWNYFAADGTLIETTTGTVQGSARAGEDFDFFGPDDFYGSGDEHISASFELNAGPGPRGFPNNSVTATVGTQVGNDTQAQIQLPACTGGTVPGTTDLPNQNGAPGVGASAATMVVYPKCQNCDGTPCSPGTQQAARCATMTVRANAKIGVDGGGSPIFEAISVPMIRASTCAWSGQVVTDLGLVGVTIAPESGSCDHSGDSGTWGTGAYGFLLWKIIFTTPLGAVSSDVTTGPFPAASACPPTTFNDAGTSFDDSGPYVSDIELAYDDTCGDS